MDAVLVGVGIGAFVVGFTLASLLSRRGRRLHLEWKLSIRTEDIHVESPGPEGAAPLGDSAPGAGDDG